MLRMRPSLRPQTAARLLIVSIALAVCYFVLHHEGRTWNGYNVFSSATSSAPASPVPTRIPEKLWYKVDANGLTDQLRDYTDSCIKNNPKFHAEFSTNAWGDDFIKKHFEYRPDIVENFLAISIPIVKADLLRYLVLYEQGGIWNDLDVSCEAPIDEWIPEQYKTNAHLTIMARPKSPHLLTVIEDTLQGLLQKADKLKVGIQHLKFGMIDDVVEVSGPQRMTRSILKSLSNMLGQSVDWKDISHVSEPRLIGDVLVLPDYAFADAMNQIYGDKKSGRKLVAHHYAGSWKKSKGEREVVNT
ncbi:initiation-specific alpha-1,6-mannosyltransferase [Pestalotiopsis sp. NC0098]|nr:initiation-specific alpha-1,6-mannosyltransferase [Pestalotiopsis sp. NC0098]